MFIPLVDILGQTDFYTDLCPRGGGTAGGLMRPVSGRLRVVVKSPRARSKRETRVKPDGFPPRKPAPLLQKGDFIPLSAARMAFETPTAGGLKDRKGGGGVFVQRTGR